MGKKERAASENVRVVVRVRPLSSNEADDGNRDVVDVNLANGTVVTPREQFGEPRTWHFNAVYNNSFTQRDIFCEEAAPLIDYVLAGYNATIFAYGQSGSGKTYTMSGHGDTEPGILPNTITYLFDKIKEMTKLEPKKRFNVKLVFIEIYQDKVTDLLAAETNKQVPIRLSGNTFDVPQATQKQLTTSAEAMECFNFGNSRRHVASHKLNDRSSRSHSIFILKLEMIDEEIAEAPKRVVSKFNLVDLAGSERQSKTGAGGDILAEGAKINASLLALGCCIDAIIKGDFIPYRSTSLTMLLKDSLGGNAKTLMFANISPASGNLSETTSTLGFASRAKQIKNEPHKNLDPKDAIIVQLKERVADLEAQLGIKPEDTSPVDELNAELARLQLQLQESRADAETQREKFNNIIATRDEQLHKLRAELEEGEAAKLVAQQLEIETQRVNELRHLLTSHLQLVMKDSDLPQVDPSEWGYQLLADLLHQARANMASTDIDELREELERKKEEAWAAQVARNEIELKNSEHANEIHKLKASRNELESKIAEVNSELDSVMIQLERYRGREEETKKKLNEVSQQMEAIEQEKRDIELGHRKMKAELERIQQQRKEEKKQQQLLLKSLQVPQQSLEPGAEVASPAGSAEGVLGQSTTSNKDSVPATGDEPAAPLQMPDKSRQRPPVQPLDPEASRPASPGSGGPATPMFSILEELKSQLVSSREEQEAAKKRVAELEDDLQAKEEAAKSREAKLMRNINKKLSELQEEKEKFEEGYSDLQKKVAKQKQINKQLKQEIEDMNRQHWSESEAKKAEVEGIKRALQNKQQELEHTTRQLREAQDQMSKATHDRETLERELCERVKSLEESRHGLQQAQSMVNHWREKCHAQQAVIDQHSMQLSDIEQEWKNKKMEIEAKLIQAKRQAVEEKEQQHKKKVNKLKKEMNTLRAKMDLIREECQEKVAEAEKARDLAEVTARDYQLQVEEEKAKLLRAQMTEEERNKVDWERRQQAMRDDMRRQAEARATGGVRALLEDGDWRNHDGSVTPPDLERVLGSPPNRHDGKNGSAGRRDSGYPRRTSMHGSADGGHRRSLLR